MRGRQGERLGRLGERMRAAAYARGLDSVSIGRALGVGSSTVRHWWQGRYEIPAGRFFAYADLVGVPVALLVGEPTERLTHPAGQATLLKEILDGHSFQAAIARIRPRPEQFTPKQIAALNEDAQTLRHAVERRMGHPWSALTPAEKQEILALLLADLDAESVPDPRA